LLRGFSIFYSRNVPRSDPFNGKSDPFVKCYWSRGVKGNQVRFFTTEVVDNVENADFNQTIEFANYIRGTDLVRILDISN